MTSRCQKLKVSGTQLAHRVSWNTQQCGLLLAIRRDSRLPLGCVVLFIVLSNQEMVSTSSDLIDGVRRQDSLAWVRLVRIYSPLVYHWCRQKERLPPEDAADVLQDVFSAVAKGITGFQKNDNQGSFRGWLRRITTNKIHDFHRRNSQLAPS